MDLSFLPTVNALLNGLSALLLGAGLVMVKQKRITAHRNCMIGAFGVSTLFLLLYVTHKVWRMSQQGELHTVYHGEGWLKNLYRVILLTHLILAMTVPVFAIVLIRLGLKGRITAHRKAAHFGFPIWMYVSVTGVVIYLMLYHWNPPPVS